MLGDKIKKRRVELGISVSELAKNIGVSRKTVYSWENGAKIPLMKYGVFLSEFLKTDIEDLVNDEQSEVSQAFVDGLATDINEIKDRVSWSIEYVIKNNSLSNEKLAKIMGLSTASIDGYRRKLRLPSTEFYLFFEHNFNFSFEWFMRGRGEPFPGARVKYPEVCGPEIREYKINESQIRYEPGEFVIVPQFRSPISAGTGLIPDENMEMRVAFRRDWIIRKGNPKNMSLIKISGDSMEPTLYAGDLVLVNHSRNYLDPQGGIYAIAINNSIMVKRIHPDLHAGKVKIISDNSKYPPIEVDLDQVKINGKVIWFAREIEK